MPDTIIASEFYALQECDRMVYLNHHGDPAKHLPPTAFQRMLFEQGIAHEQAVLNQISLIRPVYMPADLRAGFKETLNLMRRGVEVIAQGVLLDGDLAGIPDLLIRAGGDSKFGPYHYRPADIKLASRPTLAYQLQVMAYCKLLESAQGRLPEGELWLKAKAGDHPGAVTISPVVYQLGQLSEPVNLLRAIIRGEIIPEPYLHSACKECGWRDLCVPPLIESRDVSLLSGMKRSVLDVLRTRGIRHLADLAAMSADELVAIKGVGVKTAGRLIGGAKAILSGEAIQIGKPKLPVSDHEIFFDVESVPTEEVIYLMGFLVRDDGGERFLYEIADDKAGEGAMWARFLDQIETLPGPIYHYGAYERTVMRDLSEAYGGADRAEALMTRFIDLEKALKEAIIPPLMGCSLKDVAPWLGFEWTSVTKGGADSIQEYTHWLEDGDHTHLERIIAYNADDCRATRVVKDYLVSLSD